MRNACAHADVAAFVLGLGVFTAPMLCQWWGRGGPLEPLQTQGAGGLRKGASRATSLFPQYECLKSCLQRFQRGGGGAVRVHKAQARPPPPPAACPSPEMPEHFAGTL